MKQHWTEQMFVRHGNLFVKVIEASLPSAPKESEQLSSILKKHGVKKNQRVLDLGCGIGRHSVNLAKLGYKVVGVDLSLVHLRRAKELAESLGVTTRTKFILCDYRCLDRCLEVSGSPFRAVINLWSTIGYYSDESDIRTLKQCREHSERNAVLVIETLNGEWLAKHFLSTSYSEMGDLLLLEERKMNRENARIDTKWRFYKKSGSDLTHKATVSFEFRVYTLHELISSLSKAGWRYLESYGGLEQGPLNPDARRMLVVAKAA